MRCQHNQKITSFCITQTCTWKECAGCNSCMKKYHNHIGKTEVIEDHQMNELLQKLIVPVDIKTKCRSFQEAVYHYFNFLKTQLNNCLDNVSRSMISRISSPYICRQGYLSAYKKFKNNDYRKFTTKQLLPFINFLKELDQQKFIEQQKNLYHAQASQIVNVITDINKLMLQLKQSSTKYFNNFDCGVPFFQKIIKINNTRMQDSPQRADKNQTIEINITKPIPDIANSETKQLNKVQNTAQSSRKPLITLEVPEKPKKQRKVSIDNTLTFEPIKNNLTQYDKNQKQIEEKMKKLMSMMNKNTQKNSSSTKQRLQKATQVSQPVEQTNMAAQQINNKLEQSNHEVNQQKTPEEIFNTFIEQGINIPSILQTIIVGAHTDIPITEDKKKLYENTEDVKKKTIKVPMKAANQQQQPMSPILKNRKKKQSQNFTLGLTKSEESNKQVSVELKTEQKQIQQNIEIGQNQSKSIALLINSLHLPSKQAITLLQSALKYASNNLSAAQYLSYLYLDNSRAKDCLNLCNEMLQKMQFSAQYQQLSVHLINNKAAALNLLGRYSQSIAILQQLIKKSQKDILYKNLADAYYCIGITEKAIESYQKAVELNPNSDQAYFNMGVCQVAQQHYHHAKQSMIKCLKLAPNNEAYLQFNSTLEKKISEIVGS